MVSNVRAENLSNVNTTGCGTHIECFENDCFCLS